MAVSLPYDVIKAQVEEAVKEGLKVELATKEDLALLRGELREDLLRLEYKLEKRFLVLLAVMLAGFTIFNPGFIQTLKAIIGLFG